MNTFKNYIIALLAGLLVLSLFTQPAQSAGISKEAKIVQYTVCMNLAALKYDSHYLMDVIIPDCVKYRP